VALESFRGRSAPLAGTVAQEKRSRDEDRELLVERAMAGLKHRDV
jgi:hypothetical protein